MITLLLVICLQDVAQAVPDAPPLTYEQVTELLATCQAIHSESALGSVTLETSEATAEASRQLNGWHVLTWDGPKRRWSTAVELMGMSDQEGIRICRACESFDGANTWSLDFGFTEYETGRQAKAAGYEPRLPLPFDYPTLGTNTGSLSLKDRLADFPRDRVRISHRADDLPGASVLAQSGDEYLSFDLRLDRGALADRVEDQYFVESSKILVSRVQVLAGFERHGLTWHPTSGTISVSATRPESPALDKTSHLPASSISFRFTGRASPDLWGTHEFGPIIQYPTYSTSGGSWSTRQANHRAKEDQSGKQPKRTNQAAPRLVFAAGCVLVVGAITHWRSRTSRRASTSLHEGRKTQS